MKNLTLTVLLLALAIGVQAQNYARKLKKATAIEVAYQSSYKGKVSPGTMLMRVSGTQVALERQAQQRPQQPAAAPTDRPVMKQPVTHNYMDFSVNKSFNVATLPDGRVISTAVPFEIGKTKPEQDFREDVEAEPYLGLKCRRARSIVNSNTIDIWYTQELNFKGSPQSAMGVPNGLVLRVVRNGDTVQEAISIKELKNPGSLLPETWGEDMDSYEYQYELNHYNELIYTVFDQQTICFNGAKLSDELKDGEQYSCGGGSIILRKVKLPDYVEDRDCYAEVIQYSDGDAYDRTGSVFVIPTDKKQSFIDAIRNLKSVPSFKANDGGEYHGLVSTADYDVPVELMRFFTGFGVRKFNHNKVRGQQWVDSVVYKTNVTPLIENLKGEAWIGAYIGNWDGKGHKVSLKLHYYPEGENPVHKTMPLFNTVNYLEQAGQPYPTFMLNDDLKATFTLKEPAKRAALLYTTTGHGGWGGGDEFNQKVNTILLDGQKVISFIPWRDDCATYRNWNPCSGNFSNGVSSSDLSRSNWCPATVTNPEYIFLGDLEAGEHTITVQIPQGAPEGGSNSYWCISGTLIFF